MPEDHYENYKQLDDAYTNDVPDDIPKSDEQTQEAIFSRAQRKQVYNEMLSYIKRKAFKKPVPIGTITWEMETKYIEPKQKKNVKFPNTPRKENTHYAIFMIDVPAGKMINVGDRLEFTNSKNPELKKKAFVKLITKVKAQSDMIDNNEYELKAKFPSEVEIDVNLTDDYYVQLIVNNGAYYCIFKTLQIFGNGKHFKQAFKDDHYNGRLLMSLELSDLILYNNEAPTKEYTHNGRYYSTNVPGKNSDIRLITSSEKIIPRNPKKKLKIT